MTESAPNWDQGQGLSWSGKWHIIATIVPARKWAPEYANMLCGTAGWLRDRALSIEHLQAIATGRKPAPVCKRCERAQAKREDSQR